MSERGRYIALKLLTGLSATVSAGFAVYGITKGWSDIAAVGASSATLNALVFLDLPKTKTESVGREMPSYYSKLSPR